MTMIEIQPEQPKQKEAQMITSNEIVRNPITLAQQMNAGKNEMRKHFWEHNFPDIALVARTHNQLDQAMNTRIADDISRASDQLARVRNALGNRMQVIERFLEPSRKSGR